MHGQSSNFLEEYKNNGLSFERCVNNLLYEFDFQEKKYKFYGANDGFDEYIFNNSAELSFEKWLSIIHPEDRSLVKKTMSFSSGNYNSYKIYYKIKNDNGFFQEIQDSAYISKQKNHTIKKVVGTIIKVKNNCFSVRNEGDLNSHLINSSIQEGVFQIDDTGKIIYGNIAAQKIFGYNKNELIDKYFHNILVPDYNNGFQDSLKALLKSGNPEIIGKYIELEATRKNGEVIPIELYISSLIVSEKFNAVIVVRDISERKLKEKIVSETISFEKLVTSISSRFIGNINIDDIIYFSLRDMGIERNVDRVFLFLFENDLFHQDSKYEWCKEGIESHINYYNKTPLSKYPWVMQHLKNGGYLEINNINNIPKEANNFKQDLIKNNIKCTLAFPILMNEQLIGLIGFDLETKKRNWTSNDRALLQFSTQVIANVIERKYTDEKLKQSEKKFRTFFESSKDGIILLDIEGKIIESNQAFLEMVECSIEEVKSLKITQIIKFDRFSDKNEKTKRELDIIGYFEEFESELVKKNGKDVPVSILLWTLGEKDEKVNRIWASIRDISERKKALKLQEKFKESLENEVVLRTNELNMVLKKQKLYLDHIAKISQFKTEFLASMSHELRTPLNAIIGFSELLLEESYGKLNKEQLEFISDIQNSSSHLLDMITKILDISKIESGELNINIEKFNLYNLIKHVISSFKPLIQKRNLKIENNFNDKKRIIQADKVKLKQILYNLIGNAVKFSIEGKITLELTEDDDYWTFKVKDSGIGIAKEDFDNIFKDFKRVNSAYVNSVPGSGLGLALTKRIVNLHGGIITFESVLGVGSTFIFTILKNYEDKVNRSRVNKFLESL